MMSYEKLKITPLRKTFDIGEYSIQHNSQLAGIVLIQPILLSSYVTVVYYFVVRTIPI